MGIRKKSLTLEKKNTILTRWIQGRSRGAIAVEINRDISTVSKFLKRSGVPSNAHSPKQSKVPPAPKPGIKTVKLHVGDSKKMFKYEVVYNVLREICNLNGEIYMSDAYIASLAGYTPQCTSQIIHYLQRSGLLKIEKRVVKELGYVRIIILTGYAESSAA